jgi:serpin B
MRRSRALVPVIVTAALLAATACSGGSSAGGNAANGGTVPARGVLAGQVQKLPIGSVTPAHVAAADTEFGFALFARLCAAQPTANVVLSPASAAQALGMLDAGASGGTRTSITHLLQLPAWNADLVAALHQQSVDLGALSQVKVSNHVFEQNGLSPTRSTLNDLTTAYAADLRELDFRDEPAATNAINAVVSHDTDRLIPALFSQPLEPVTQTVLADAILLDAKWQDPFPAARPGVFHAASGKTATATMMQNAEGSFPARSSAGWTSVVLPYSGGRLRAVALLPPASSSGGGGSTTQCTTPSQATLSALTQGTSGTAGVVLPKLDLSATLPLTATLASMGLPRTGDYSGLGSPDDQISTVVQKVVMKVDQQGTKAAAATGVGVTTLARTDSTPVVFDRPFLLLLQDTATHTPLFLARVASP